MNPMQKMKELVKKLNEADAAYFQKDNPIMTDREYDAMLLELTMLERATGIHFADSPVGRVASDFLTERSHGIRGVLSPQAPAECCM